MLVLRNLGTTILTVSERINYNLVCKRHARFLNRHLTANDSAVCNQNYSSNNFIQPQHLKLHRSIATSSPVYEHETAKLEKSNKQGFIKRIFENMKFNKETLKNSGYLLYEKCTDGINTESFIKKCKMQDTYFSWFLITELHTWMCMVRVMEEGDDGKTVRNAIVEALWKDADVRAKKVGATSLSKRREQLKQLHEQFLAALFLYDEGLQSSDKVLASALWYRLLNKQCDDAELLAHMVKYVRQQILQLEKFSREDVLVDGKISFSPL
ncbi:hypothetical protein CHUAL_008898 [Chamberlinius hualienensis]